MNIRIDPDTHLRPQPAAPADTTAADGGWAELATGALTNPYLLTAAATLTAVLAVAITTRALRRRTTKTSGGGSLDKALTFFAAAVATGVVGTGMWAFFEDTLGVTNPYLRTALFAFFELAMLAEALRSRSFRLTRAAKEHNNPPAPGEAREFDVDGLAVWILAGLSGTLAATHETTFGGAALRLVAPAVAAWLWERGLAGELRQFTRVRTGRPNPAKVLWGRLMVALDLADADDMSLSERATARRLNRLARARFKVHTLEVDGANKASLAYARWVARRRFIAAVNTLDLAGNPELRRSLQERIAVLTGANEGMSPDAVAYFRPWAPPAVEDAEIVEDIARGDAEGSVTSVTDGVTRLAVTDTATPSPDATVTGDAERTVTPGVTTAPHDAVTGVTDPTVTRPRRVTAPRPRPTVTAPATPAAAFEHLRHLVDQARNGMTQDQIEEYATQRAQTVIADNGTKVAGMREYFLTCVVMGGEVVGTRMAKAVEGSEGKGRQLAKEWLGQLAEDDAEQVLTEALSRITAERSGGDV